VPALLAAGCATTPQRSLGFVAIAGSSADRIELPDEYTYDVVARWGDSLFAAVTDLDTSRLIDGALFEPQAVEQQRNQFGQNCDAIHCFSLDRDRALLCVNNEYTDDALMFVDHPGFAGAVRGEGRAYVQKHPQLVAVAQAAVGVSVIEIARAAGRWQLVKDSRFNRRITANTPTEVAGPARGSALLRTNADPTGTRVLGTFGGCAGGETPWGTYLTCEENIQDYFGNLAAAAAAKDADPFAIDAHRRFRMWKQA
jgi:secreted PhoX family phosphatase